MTLLALTSLAIVSCSKETTLENRLDGETWKYTKMTSVINGKTSEKTDLTATISFKDDGTGTSKENDSSTEKSFTWKVVANGDSLQIQQNTTKMTFRVLTNKKQSQVWSLGNESGPYYFKYELEKQ